MLKKILMRRIPKWTNVHTHYAIWTSKFALNENPEATLMPLS